MELLDQSVGNLPFFMYFATLASHLRSTAMYTNTWVLAVFLLGGYWTYRTSALATFPFLITSFEHLSGCWFSLLTHWSSLLKVNYPLLLLSFSVCHSFFDSEMVFAVHKWFPLVQHYLSDFSLLAYGFFCHPLKPLLLPLLLALGFFLFHWSVSQLPLLTLPYSHDI